MKKNAGFIILAVVAVLLAVGIIAIRQSEVKRQEADASTILDFSNQWTRANLKVEDLNQVNVALHNDVSAGRTMLADLSNSLAAASLTATNLGNSLASAQSQITTDSTRIGDLQQQNKELSDQALSLATTATELTNRINALTGQINDTTRQLAESQTNNSYLEQQLQQLILARAELEHKFDTLAAVREQMKKLEDDIYTARRLRWIKEGSQEPLKGGPLMVRFRDHGGHSGNAENYGLHVELGTDGSLKSLSSTNAPAR